MNLIDDVICRDFRCPDVECLHHKNIVRNYTDTFLFKMAPKNRFYDCSMDHFKCAGTWIVENKELSPLAKEYIALKGIKNAKILNFAYGDDDVRIQEYLSNKRAEERENENRQNRPVT